MSGVTDAPFRRQADRFGAPAVVTEMVAGAELAIQRPDVVRRMEAHGGRGPFIVQLIGRDPEYMRLGAEMARSAGADVIDINMGCPSRQVTGGQSGSALMRDLDLAERLVEATLEGSGGVTVTLKMRLGWDETTLNAPDLALRAEQAGVAMVTVHGRTRQQFYKGHANWRAIRAVRDAVSIPVIANGDIGSTADARTALTQSAADGVMIGRSAVGRPWLIGEIAADLFGTPTPSPSLDDMVASLAEQIEDSLALYGARIGLKTVRKHVSAAIDHWPLGLSAETRKALRGDLCRIEDPQYLLSRVRAMSESRVMENAA